jgi:hypothetical protein
MRIIEIFLPKGTDRSLSPQSARKIDALQARMTKYVDAILDPKTSAAGREFLKSRLRDDYHDLKGHIGSLHAIAENENTQYEVYDRRTGERVSGPYSTRVRASRVADKKDLEYGAVRFGYRPVRTLTEAVHKLPLSDNDFELVKELMLKPIPAAIAPIYIMEIIQDDELTDQIMSLEDTQPGRDVRPLIVEWFNRVMPDQMYRFTGEEVSKNQKEGLLSPIHGYDPKMYKGTNDPITGDAFGRL